MKNSLVIGILCLGIGFAAAWLIKPDGDPETVDNPPPKKGPAVASTKPSRPGLADSNQKPADTKSPTRVRRIDQPSEIDEETRRERRSGRDRWAEMMKKRQMAKEEAQIKKLIDRLGLTEEQADQLRAYFEKNRSELMAMMEDPENRGDWSKMGEFAKLLRADDLDDALAGILSDEQKEAYAEMKERDRVNSVEARAYKDLARIQGVLDLTQEQKDQVYDILYEQADKKSNAETTGSPMVTMISEGLGIDLDPEDLGITGDIEAQIANAATGGDADPEAFMTAMQESRQRQIDQQVELLAPVLDESQQEAYRAHLQTRGNGLFNGLVLPSSRAEVENAPSGE